MADNDELQAHMEAVKSLFQVVEHENWGAELNQIKDGKICAGIDYDQFKDLLTKHMNVEFDTEDEFDEICQSLDPEEVSQCRVG